MTPTPRADRIKKFHDDAFNFIFSIIQLVAVVLLLGVMVFFGVVLFVLIVKAIEFAGIALA